MIYPKVKDLVILPLFYSVACGLLYYHQKSLLYFPDKTDSFDGKVWKPIETSTKTLALESLDNYKKIVVLFHGNTANANVRSYYQRFFPSDVHIVVAEYPGFGLNKSLPISKESFITHARELMRYLVEQYGEDYAEHITIAGESLGTGIASQMATEFSIKHLLLITPYSSIADVAQGKFWYAPVALLLKDNYNSIDNLQSYKGKTMLLISEHDKVIPPKFAIKLFNAIPNNKEKIIVKGAAHSNWLQHITAEQTNQVSQFVKL